MNITFIHGWGFDARFWDELAALLPQFPQHRIDLGFFGEAKADFAQHSILIGHSYGFMHGMQRSKTWAGWIAINGFPRFASAGELPGCVPAAAVHKMKKQLQHDPRKTLADFYKNIGAENPPAGIPDVDKLSLALDELHEGDIGDVVRSSAVPNLTLAAKNDPLVPAAIGEKMGRVKWHPTGGHTLPQSEPQWCAEAIADFIAGNFGA